MKKILLIFACLTAFRMANAQSFTVPANIKLEKAEDYAKYEKDIINCVNWLESTPLDEQTDKRKEANAFLLMWISGSPNVSVQLQEYVLGLNKKNTDFLMIFMGGWTRYAIQNPDEKDNLKFNVEAVKSIIKVYKAGKGVKKDKKVQEVVSAEEKGELEKWIKSKLK